MGSSIFVFRFGERDMARAPFQSSVTNYSDIRKRAEELGFIKPAEGTENGVTLPVEKPPSKYTPTTVGPIYGDYT